MMINNAVNFNENSMEMKIQLEKGKLFNEIYAYLSTPSSNAFNDFLFFRGLWRLIWGQDELIG